jgi:aminotransferase
MEDVEFCQRLLEEQGVAMIPGSAFGPSGAGYARAAYVQPVETLLEAADRIGRFVESVG